MQRIPGMDTLNPRGDNASTVGLGIAYPLAMPASVTSVSASAVLSLGLLLGSLEALSILVRNQLHVLHRTATKCY